jgi:hypothetical protein
VLPNRQWFEERPWFFHDHDLSVKNEPRLRYFDHRSLGIRFQGEDPACQPLPLPPHIVATTVAAGPPVRQFTATEMLRLSAPVQVSALQPAAVVIGASTFAGLDRRMKETIQVERLKRGEQKVLLELSDVTFDRPPSAGFDVYLNLEPGEAASRESAKFVGTLGLFGLRHDAAMHAHSRASQVFDVSRAFEGSMPGEFTIRIVPFDLLVPRGSEPPLRRPDAVRIGGVRIVALSRAT